MTVRYDQNGITIHEADALQVATTYPANHFTLAILDGPYAMNKAEWDRLKVDDLPRWYRPHLEAADRILAPSASLYLWNTAEGWATLHPMIVSMGWAYRGLIVWDKKTAPTMISNQSAHGWPNIVEVCGHYDRGEPEFRNADRLSNLWPMPAVGYSNEKARHPTKTLKKVANGLVWAAPLHPCQKPLIFADRMIRASTRPGERVWVPFGGTCREAIAADRIRRSGPADAREVVTCELNQDGPDYLDPVVRILNGEGSRPADPRQVALL
jgi:hypothetical protein